jgi:hypothetical protein
MRRIFRHLRTYYKKKLKKELDIQDGIDSRPLNMIYFFRIQIY